MARNAPGILCRDLSVVLIHALSIFYFGLLAANFLCGFLSLPLHQVQSAISDDLVILLFLLAVISFSFLCLRSRITQRTSALEQASVIVLIAASTISFIYFQFYHEKWPCRFYMVTSSLFALHSVSRYFQHNASFPELCVRYGMISILPAIHATIRPSACRLPMIPSFIAFLSLNAVSGLNLLLRVPERFSGIRSHPISCFILHASILIATTFLSERLLAAKASDATFSADECRGLIW